MAQKYREHSEDVSAPRNNPHPARAKWSPAVGRTVRALFALCLFFAPQVVIRSQTVLTQEEDAQTWDELAASFALARSVRLDLRGQIRLGQNLHDLIQDRAGANLAIGVGRYVTLAPSYIYIVRQLDGARQSVEHRPFFDASVRIPFGAITLDDRHRVERQYRDPGRDRFVYRHRLQADWPLRLGQFDMTGYINDEVFYDSSERAWVRHRISAGFGKRLTSRTGLEVYYLRQWDGFSRPGDLHVAGVVFRVRLH